MTSEAPQSAAPRRERAADQCSEHPQRGSPADGGGLEAVTVDCDRCSMRGIGCGDCVITVLLGGPPDGVALNSEERRAIDVLAAAGMVPPLRMVQPLDVRHHDPG
ncbi:MAG: hypothetical protein WKF82_12055 [Nocardioidaceae bacterium]